MLSFTAHGAVRTPLAVQVRVGVFEPGALRAGAPLPSRSITSEELIKNIDFFTIGRTTTRTRPCTLLTLSGCIDRDVSEAIEHARRRGITNVVLHGTAPDSVLERVDSVAMRVEKPIDLQRFPEHASTTAIVPITLQTLPVLDTLIDALLERRPSSVSFRWPFPDPSALPPTLSNARSILEQAMSRLGAAGQTHRWTGLPACLTGVSNRPRRTQNRFYVDADHQEADALLFFPDVVELAKPDTCRACTMTAWCDGVARTWLEHGGLGVLQPIARR